MDCEKFEPLLLDELYEELDEVTSAAVKRHVSGCARCASILTGMRGTRRAAALPMMELPAGLEDRILASVKEAQKVVPIQSRASRALSWAGSWAMRPQTAMAAVFLLMIGTSAFVIRSRNGGPAAGDSALAVSVTEKGVPAGQAPLETTVESLDNKAAAAAHGANMPAPSTLPPAASPAASSALALAGDPSSPAGLLDGVTSGKGRGRADDSKALASALSERSAGVDKDGDMRRQQAEAKKEDAPADKKPAQRPSRNNSGMENAGAPAGAPYQDYAPGSQAIAPPPPSKAADVQDGYSAGVAAYRSRNFTEATRQFDSAARSGDANAALWAAKSVKEGSGCPSAMGRFDAIASRAAGSFAGNEATLELARCQIAAGQLDSAREKLAKLVQVSSHSAAAQQALNELNQVAARREAERAKAAAAGGGTGRAAEAAPARAPAATTRAAPATVDKASGF